MANEIVEFLPAAAFYLLALAAQVSGYTSPTVAIAIAGVATAMLLIPTIHHSHRWHTLRKSDGRRGLDSWYFIVLAGIVAVAAIGAAGYGIGLRASKSEIVIRDNASADPVQPGNAIISDLPLTPPKLGTQVAKEDFQKAINDMSQIVSHASSLVKATGELVGNRPLIRMDNDNGGDLVAKLQQLDTDWKLVYHALMDGTGGEFFAKFPPTQKQALMSVLPNNSQRIWEIYHRELIKFTVAVMMIQDAHPKRLENGAQFERARANADFAADDLINASSPLHDWVQSVTQRMDQMSNQI
jgi:hypothetical protein